MASLFKRNGSFYTLQFNFQGKRRTIRLQTKEKKTATKVKEEIERIIDFKQSGIAFDLSIHDWIEKQNPEFRERIAAAGLIEHVTQISTVRELGEYYKENFKSDVYATDRGYQLTINKLNEFFGDQLIATIKHGDAEEFIKWLLKHGSINNGKLAKASVSGMVGKIKHIFKKAVNKGWIRTNPFSEIKSGPCKNDDRIQFVSIAEFDDLVKLFPGKTAIATEQRLILALARWGGLRVPSEPKGLLWDWFDLDNDRFKVFATKTGYERVVPIFPQLRPFVDAAISKATDRKFVCPWLRSRSNGNFYSILSKRIDASDLKRWPRLLQNLRASRSNEIERDFGPKLESAWIGHNTQIAETNYFSVSESDFAKATTTQSVLAQIIEDPDRLNDEVKSLSPEEKKQLLDALKKSKKKSSIKK